MFLFLGRILILGFWMLASSCREDISCVRNQDCEDPEVACHERICVPCSYLDGLDVAFCNPSKNMVNSSSEPEYPYPDTDTDSDTDADTDSDTDADADADADGDPVTWTSDIHAIFQARCLSCHGPGSNRGDLTTYARTVYYIETKPTLRTYVSSGHYISGMEKTIVLDWIDNGYPE